MIDSHCADDYQGHHYNDQENQGQPLIEDATTWLMPAISHWPTEIHELIVICVN